MNRELRAAIDTNVLVLPEDEHGYHPVVLLRGAQENLTLGYLVPIEERPPLWGLIIPGAEEHPLESERWHKQEKARDDLVLAWRENLRRAAEEAEAAHDAFEDALYAAPGSNG